MKTLRVVCVVAFVGAAITAGLSFGTGRAADPANAAPPPPPQADSPSRLVVHEWGTFTSFSGSDGVPVGFRPNNSDLPSFVYSPEEVRNSKAGRLLFDGTVSMETPVIYFYTDTEVRASVRVDFPRGWVTEWYPFAAMPPKSTGQQSRAPGQSMRWNVRLLAGESPRFPRDKQDNHYYCARETDAVPVQVEAETPDNRRSWELQGGTVIQREKFLFYRGVGSFPLPVAVRPLGGGKVRVTNAAKDRLDGLVLATVRGGKVGFHTIGSLKPGAEVVVTQPVPNANSSDLAAVMEKELTAAGLYPKEARAMVKTWDSAWFGENGNRLLYLVPRARTDELLPLAIDPRPTETVRVLVGRHDFLTPEQEVDAERQVQRARAARAELNAAEKELQKIGRFADQAGQMAERRLDRGTARK